MLNSGSEALSLFSDWTLALLQRLFLYPGGLWALGALLWLGAMRNVGTLKRWNVGTLERSHLLAAAVAWAGLALSPLPSAAPMPVPADRFALVGLLVTSRILDSAAGQTKIQNPKSKIQNLADVALPLAALAPLA